MCCIYIGKVNSHYLPPCPLYKYRLVFGLRVNTCLLSTPAFCYFFSNRGCLKLVLYWIFTGSLQQFVVLILYSLFGWIFWLIFLFFSILIILVNYLIVFCHKALLLKKSEGNLIFIPLMSNLVFCLHGVSRGSIFCFIMPELPLSLLKQVNENMCCTFCCPLLLLLGASF